MCYKSLASHTFYFIDKFLCFVTLKWLERGCGPVNPHFLPTQTTMFIPKHWASRATKAVVKALRTQQRAVNVSFFVLHYTDCLENQRLQTAEKFFVMGTVFQPSVTWFASAQLVTEAVIGANRRHLQTFDQSNIWLTPALSYKVWRGSLWVNCAQKTLFFIAKFEISFRLCHYGLVKALHLNFWSLFALPKHVANLHLFRHEARSMVLFKLIRNADALHQVAHKGQGLGGLVWILWCSQACVSLG